MKAEYRDNEKEYIDYYDKVEVCAESSIAHPKSAIEVWSTEQTLWYAVCSIITEGRIALYSMQKNNANG